MNRWVPPLCVLASIGALFVVIALRRLARYSLRASYAYACRYITRHVDAALAPSNVTRLDSRRKAGENVTVLRSVKP